MQPSPQDLSNPSFLQKLALDLIRSRKSNYLEDCIYYHLQENRYIMEDIPDLRNKYRHLLKCTYIKHRLSLLEKVQQDFAHNKKMQKTPSTEKCIIYLHGLGSNRVEGFSILPHLPKSYSLLAFDLSGSGKSQGEFTTYGFREKEDIQSILMYLYKHKNIREFIIWGRSMGAVASLLFNNLMLERQTETSRTRESNQTSLNLSTVFKCVKCIIADSPFSSFQSISKDIALKKMSIPNFFTQIALKFLQNSFDKLLYDNKLKQCFTPFQIDFTKNCLKPVVPIIFVYSLNDEIVNCEHSEKIIKSVQKIKAKLIEKVIIPDCGHNLKRPQNVYEVIFQKIERHCQASRQTQTLIESKNHGNSLSNFSTQKKQESIQKHTKSVRRKSFWNFEEQLLEKPQLPKSQNDLQISSHQEKQIQPINKFLQFKATQQNGNSRKSIFNRDQKSDTQKMNTSITKKRGLSLSSTIERNQEPIKQMNSNFKNNQNIKIINDEKSQSFISVRPTSVQHKTSNNITNEEQSKTGSPSPKKGIVRCNAQLMNSNFSKSIKNRPSLSGNKPRISLGGSVDKKSKLPIEFFTTTAQSKIISKQNYKTQMAPERDSSNPTTFSTISFSDQTMYSSVEPKKPFQTITFNKQNKSLRNKIEQHFDSEPNIIKEEEFNLRRISSRQSINTIEGTQLNHEIDESLTSFINTKLEFGLESFSLGSGFIKYKTISPTSRENKGKESLILSEIDIKQVTEMAQTSNKLSTITMPTHITLRPSSRLYHEKRKKKLQAHNNIINKQNQNLKITNQKYLFDD